MVAANTSRDPATHSAKRSSSPIVNRASAPAMFWSVFKAAAPIRSVW
ncbi:Uncharacterised protein [Mycobacterium tuberculosis]|nr:Uncharacterised protein [Mycobacterium tuberculosis]